jgi:hypothetical protein
MKRGQEGKMIFPDDLAKTRFFKMIAAWQFGESALLTKPISFCYTSNVQSAGAVAQ